VILILTLTQDCAALVLGYYRFSLREKNVGGFIFSWASGAAGPSHGRVKPVYLPMGE